MLEEPQIIELLKNSQVKPTPIRVQLYLTMSKIENTFSLLELENRLLDIDKSTLFRNIILFRDHHLIHSVDDGSGSLKYCLCDNQGDCQMDETHCHFFCEVCKKTYCLNENVITNIQLPQEFQVKQINYVIKGVCANCSKNTEI